MDSKKQGNNKAPLFVLLAALCWSLGGVFVKSSSWSGLSIAVLRGTLTLIVYLCILGIKNIHLTKTKALIGLCFFMQSILYMIANKYTTAGSVTALQNTSPIYIILLNALLLKRRPQRGEIAVCFMLLLGIFMTMAGGGMTTNLLGNFLALISGIFYACVFFFSSTTRVDALESLVLGNALYVPLLPLLFADAAVWECGIEGWVLPILCGLICGTAAWLFFRMGIAGCPPLKANFIAMVEPVASPLWTLIFLGERMSWLSLAGCALVIVTLLIYAAKGRSA